LRAWLIATTQAGATPVQAPLQPAKALPAAGVAVSVTCAPLVNALLQALPKVS
jgi:hypothetical protein